MNLIAMSTSSTAKPFRFRVPPLLVLAMSLLSVLLTFNSTANAQGTTVVEIGSGIIDQTLATGQRWKRHDFDPLITGTHTITAVWDSDADVRLSIFRLTGDPKPNDRVLMYQTNSSPSPSEWTGTLDSSEDYFVAVWSASGAGNYTVTLEADTGITPIEIVTQPSDLTAVSYTHLTLPTKA